MRNKTKMTNSKSFSEKFDKKMKKSRLIESGVILFLLVCVAGLTFLLNRNLHKQVQTVQTTKPIIALVNEDQPQTFNGTNYNFGETFVNLVSNDNKYNWQVLSRSVANKAYADGSVDAVIYLPQNFTHNILTLQALNPQKAELDYKVLASKSQLNNKLLQDKIVNVLYDFNTSIVKMYYASVAGNVANAQTNMGNVVKSQGTLLSSLNDNVYGPFQTTNESYSSVVSIANGLKSENDSWIQEQNSFTNSVVNLLNESSSSFNGMLPNLTNYFDTQRKITDINLTNANQGITNQANSDKSYYYDQYTAAYNKAVQAVQQFHNTDASGNETGVYAKLKNQISSYNTLISGVHDNIGTQIDSLTGKQTTLLNLEKDMYLRFYGQDISPTPDKTDFTSLETADNARSAMAKMIATSFGKRDNISGTAYPKTINNLLSNLSVNVGDYDTLLATLVKNGSLTPQQKDTYEAKLGVLKNYATAFGIKTATADFSAAPTVNNSNENFTKQITITVPKATEYTLKLQASNGLSNSGISIVGKPTGTGAIVNPDNSVTLDNRTTSITDSKGNVTTAPTTSPMTYVVTYKVDLGQAASGTVTASVDNGSGGTDSSVENFGLIPANAISEYAGGSQFGYISTLLNNIDTASSLITFLYGAPGATYSDIKSCTKVSDFQEASQQSIFKMYGNMDVTQIMSRLSDDDVKQFMNYGKANIKNVTDTLTTLNSNIASIQKEKATLSDNLPSNYFSQVSSDLQAWYNQTMDTLNAEYKAWTTNNTILLQEKPWKEYNQNDLVLCYDKEGGDSLYSTISDMVNSTAKQAEDTAASAQIIKSNAAEFDQMVDTVTKTQNDAKKVIDNTNNLLSTGNDDFKNSQNYYKNFAATLSNTRTDGVKADNIFNFFAKPLSTKDITPKLANITKDFDWRWVVIFVIGLLVGALGKTWIRHKPKFEEK
ncbi:type VII secretion protein EsaA [Clostridium acetobutylicum]|uniref:Uncharacterized conserved membrane protein, YUEB B.subtilis homolog n=1 Tax=Clostridium acetobutylicum (strain ATCC 824 / DSM 792 / JCM 1419 / IAM 19013 / LMG 5710 / NBRC 13948 / NRRL B-527 / VKM B-1787 / 2291 / W) TaxID=272562 RepID=Q97CZ3_CLOAB|nr:type VII secretion protein EsaA [Clostridium acetobutylicum]AAK81617.1 Uncharacterized conserved membrane protein, YUEB B.subtilis homolog [Clostridium acetobutylicum ATCC 824]